MEKDSRLIRVSEKDNVAMASELIPKGTSVMLEGVSYEMLEDIPFGHKVAIRPIACGEIVYKYRHPIGIATGDIKTGAWVHSHNMKTALDGKLEYQYKASPYRAVDVNGIRDTFYGYERADGSVGTRNEIWVVPTVSCVNATVEAIAQKANARYGSVCDGIHAFPHNAGCSQLGKDHETTQKILKSIINNPNAGGVLIVSLGCENNDLNHFLPVLGDIDCSRIKYMICQDVDGDEVEEGVRLIGEIADTVKTDKRTPQKVSKLCIGFKCGGSDAFSGITANPLCGLISDRLTALGGTAVLTEVPEMFGAEQSLMGRAADEQVFHKIEKLINDFKQYYLDYGQPIYENPSPGNKAGGITTLEEKSLGCIQKGGHAIVTDTLDYGQRYEKKGLNLMIGPGNDSVSITDLVSAGATMLLFTTGRGNPLGTAVPVIKISSNTGRAKTKRKWIDFDAGRLLDGMAKEALCDELWELILNTASGRYQTKNEISNNRSIMIFKNGVLL